MRTLLRTIAYLKEVKDEFSLREELHVEIDREDDVVFQ